MAIPQADSQAPQSRQPTHIGSTAAENIRFIRHTIEASQTFTMIPGKGCIAMSLLAFAAVALESTTPLGEHWLMLWLATAVLAGIAALSFMERKARLQGQSLRRAVARKFFMTLAPAFSVGFILTAALFDVVSREVVTGIWLLTYGAAIAAMGVYSVTAVIVAGMAFMALGTLALLLPPGTAVWMLGAGFGVTHLLLGICVARYHGG